MGYIKQVLAGFHFAVSDSIDAIRRMKESGITTEEKLPAIPENPTTMQISLITKSIKAKANMSESPLHAYDGSLEVLRSQRFVIAAPLLRSLFNSNLSQAMSIVIG